jgi:hypothetical protein
LQRLGMPAAAVLAVASVAPVAAVTSQAGESPAPSATTQLATATRAPDRAYVRFVSRSADRDDALVPRMAEVQGLAEEVAPTHLEPRWLTGDHTLWSGPARSTDRLARLDEGTKIMVTGLVLDGWAQVKHGGRLVWLRKDGLARTKPVAATTRTFAGSTAGVTGAPCPDGSSVESGLTTNAIKVYRAVCAAFPSVSSWGGRTGSGDHGAGLALDIMVTGSTGDAIAEFVRAHAGELGVSYVIWSQRIWTVERSSEGWRYMSDRGSTTANHYDHVHVSVF